MNIKIIGGITVIAVMAIVSYIFSTQNTQVADIQTNTKKEVLGHDMGAMTDEDHSQMNMSGAVIDGTNRVQIENLSKLPTGKTEFKFKISGVDNKELTDKELKLSHEKLMHFLVIRDDLTVFEHLHPEYANGYWKVSSENLLSGNYNLYMDISPVNEAELTLKVPLLIGSKNVIKNFPKISVGSIAKIGEYTAEILEKELEVGSVRPLTFKIIKNGSVVANIEQYLGAYGHVVMVDQNNSNNFVHAHPATEIKPTNGQVVFNAKFPNEGNYTIFAQFNIGGQIKIFPITVNVMKTGEVNHFESQSTTDESKPHGH